jgi:hypothetical protein
VDSHRAPDYIGTGDYVSELVKQLAALATKAGYHRTAERLEDAIGVLKEETVVNPKGKPSSVESAAIAADLGELSLRARAAGCETVARIIDMAALELHSFH